jgi:uncharacterized protein DUF177 involved in 23S rRNA accumulation
MMAGKSDERDPDRAAKSGPWRAFVPVAQIPQRGLHREIEADQATRAIMAEAAGLRELLSARASFDLTPQSGGRVHVSGRVQARVGQTCVVTLEPLENDIDEEFDLIFAPLQQIPELAVPADEDEALAGDMAQLPEPIENGIIDLGRLATDLIYLGIDPYPRKTGAMFEPQLAAADPEDHPFAALKALRTEPPRTGKPKRK